ncbi:MAG: alkaline phosphatase family protein [Prevotella sp.]
MRSARLLLLLFITVIGLKSCCAASPAARPRLVVGIVIDQMRWDYLQRYSGKWCGGVCRLLSEGYSFDNAYLPYVPSVTAAGHASIFTGTTPAIHGIAGNDFYKDGRKTYCTADTTVSTIGAATKAGEMSPRNMLSTTIGDELKLADTLSRVVGVSLKDRASILPAGHSADAAFWYDRDAGRFVSSSYYMDSLPEWAERFNALHGGRGDVRYSPEGITLTADMALAAIDGERLGQGDGVDMLTVSFSSTDYIGHKYGTMSRETEAVYMEVDRQLGRILSHLDEKVGQGRYLVFVTADHAAAHNVHDMERRHIPAGIWREETVLADANKALRRIFGIERDLVLSLIEYRFYLDHEAIRALSLDEDKVKKALASHLEQDDRVMAAVDYSDLGVCPLPEAIRRRIVLGYNRKRSGDLMVVMQPGVYAFNADSFDHGTTHGVWNPYDTHIPLLFYGWNVPHGCSPAHVSVVDIATTVCSMLQIQQPNGSVGEVLQFK